MISYLREGTSLYPNSYTERAIRCDLLLKVDDFSLVYFRSIDQLNYASHFATTSISKMEKMTTVKVVLIFLVALSLFSPSLCRKHKLKLMVYIVTGSTDSWTTVRPCLPASTCLSDYACQCRQGLSRLTLSQDIDVASMELIQSF